jgi:hypothetical protein
MLRATVRVGKGSGVAIRNGGAALVATAHHVAPGGGPHRLQWPSGFQDATVLRIDEPNDVAVLASPPQLETVAVALATAEGDAVIGDDVWVGGFPRGWDDLDPVLAKGVIAGVASESWVNVSGTWGSSGGPLCVISGGAPVVVGIVGCGGEKPVRRYSRRLPDVAVVQTADPRKSDNLPGFTPLDRTRDRGVAAEAHVRTILVVVAGVLAD